MTVTVGVLLAAGLAVTPAPAQAAVTHHLSSRFVSLGGEDRATILGPDLIAGHVYFRQTYGDCADVDCYVMGTWYVIDRDGSQLGGTYSGDATACLGGSSGDVVAKWGLGRYEGIHGQGTYGIDENYAPLQCEGLGPPTSALRWDGFFTLDVIY